MVEVNKALGSEGDASMTVSVLCYNLLAQDLIGKNRYLYSDAAPELLEWDFRKINLLKDLTDSQADVCHCFIGSTLFVTTFSKGTRTLIDEYKNTTKFSLESHFYIGTCLYLSKGEAIPGS